MTLTLSEQYPNEMLPVKVILLSQDKFAITDPEDFEAVSQFKWYAAYERGRWYAARAGTNNRGDREVIKLHTFLTGYAQTDHKNGNGLDDRRCNLRDATGNQNNANTPKQSGKFTSIYKGISWDRPASKWLARIQINTVQQILGYFDSETEAAKAYDEAARYWFGEFACVNFPRPEERGALRGDK